MAEGMTRLLHDRYYAYAAEHAWDLATGESIAIAELAACVTENLESEKVRLPVQRRENNFSISVSLSSI